MVLSHQQVHCLFTVISDIKKDSRALALQGRVSAREGCVVIGPTHVFGNIQGRWGEVWGKVHKCKEEAVTMGHDRESVLALRLKERKVLEQHKARVFRKSTLQDLCYVHNCLCDVEATTSEILSFSNYSTHSTKSIAKSNYVSCQTILICMPGSTGSADTTEATSHSHGVDGVCWLLQPGYGLWIGSLFCRDHAHMGRRAVDDDRGCDFPWELLEECWSS